MFYKDLIKTTIIIEKNKFSKELKSNLIVIFKTR